jgi:hypothetical protein
VKLTLLIIVAFLSTSALAYQIQSITQHIDLRRQNQTGWQQDILGKMTMSRKWEIGVQGTYLERYSFFENRGGLLALYHPNQSLTLEAKVLVGGANEILPRLQSSLSAYLALFEGFTPFATYKDTKYSVTRLHNASLGAEIEKFTNVLIIPQLMFGKASFDAPSKTRDVHSYGLKAVWYRERLYSLFIFGYKGVEASQGIVGKSTFLVDTKSGGLGASYHFVPQLKSELIIDHTDYEQLKNQFVTTTLNFVWDFE